MQGDTTGKPRVPSYGMLLFICCTVTGSCYFGSYMRIPIVPLYAGAYGADAFQVGMINAAFLFMAGMVSLPLGILSDCLGRKLLILTGLAISSGSSFLLYFTTSTAQMIGVSILFGISLAMFAPTMMSYAADVTPPTHLGRAYGWYTTALYSGMSVGPAAGGLAAEWMGFGPVFVLSGMVTLVVFGMAYLFLPRARHVVLRKPLRRDTRAIFRELSRNGSLLACWLVTLGGCFALGMFVTFVPLHAHQQGLSSGQIGLTFAVQALFNALSRIPFGRITDRVARKSDLVGVGLLGLTVAMGGFGLASKPVEFGLCAVVLGISMGVAFTAVGALIPEVVSADSRGLAMGGYNTSIYLGMMLSSLGMGAVAGDIGFRDCFFIVASANAATTAVFHLTMKHLRGTQNR